MGREVNITTMKQYPNAPRHLFVILPGLAVALSASNSAAEEIRGWYEAGGTVMHSAKLKSFQTEFLSGEKVEFDPGFRFGIGIGTDITPYLALEVESGFHYNAISSISGADSSEGQVYQIPVLGNVVLQWPNRTRFVPVVGMGAGAISAVLDADNLSLGPSTFSGSEQTWTFAYQAYAGVQYHFADNMAIGLFYHYMVSEGPSWGDGPDEVVKFNRLQSHSLALTLNFRF
jgi:opacity protein-like surface antigen